MIKQVKDHVIIKSPFCGEIHEILAGLEYSPNIAIAFDIGQTKAHYHKWFDEIYFVMEGSIVLKLYNPSNEQTTLHHLVENELAVISKGVHHQITDASERNRLCIMTIPQFDPNDEVISNNI